MSSLLRDTDVAVVGGGITGLACAYWLAGAGCDVRVLERASVAGGCIRTRRASGWLFECGPNTLALRPGPVRELVNAAGLAGRIDDPGPRARPRLIYARAGARGCLLFPAPASLGAVLTTPLLSRHGRVRALAEPFIRPAPPGAEESVAAFVSRRLGREFLDRIAAPFVSGVYAGDAARLSMRFALAPLHRLEQAYGSLLRGAIAERGSLAAGRSVSFAGGLMEMVRALGDTLGDRLATGIEAAAIELRSGGFEIAVRGERGAGGRLRARRLVLAAPAREAAALLRPLAPQAAEAIGEVVHAPVVSLGLRFRASSFPRPPEGFGFLATAGSGLGILGCLYTSSLFPDRAPAGRVGLTVLAGGARAPGLVDVGDDDLLDRVMADLRQVFGPLPSPTLQALTRWPRALPQYGLDHARVEEAARQAEAAHPGLRLAGSYRGGVSLADRIAEAWRVSAALLAEADAGRGAGEIALDSAERRGVALD